VKAPAPIPDDRPAQAHRVANYLETHPHSTQKEIDAVCDTGCVSKVLSDMRRPQPIGLGYGLAYDWRDVLCADGSRTRQVRTYALLHRPKTRQHDLFKTA
jgi:hypothetical protein